MSVSGKWQKLEDYLKKINKSTIVLTDEQIQYDIVQSDDSKRPYDIDFPRQQHSIRQRACDAGYSVDYHPQNKHVKIFSKFP